MANPIREALIEELEVEDLWCGLIVSTTGLAGYVL
jgi:hypothetical protein